jgi:hypothetical protein
MFYPPVLLSQAMTGLQQTEDFAPINGPVHRVSVRVIAHTQVQPVTQRLTSFTSVHLYTFYVGSVVDITAVTASVLVIGGIEGLILSFVVVLLVLEALVLSPPLTPSTPFTSIGLIEAHTPTSVCRRQLNGIRDNIVLSPGIMGAEVIRPNVRALSMRPPLRVQIEVHIRLDGHGGLPLVVLHIIEVRNPGLLFVLVQLPITRLTLVATPLVGQTRSHGVHSLVSEQETMHQRVVTIVQEHTSTSQTRVSMQIANTRMKLLRVRIMRAEVLLHSHTGLVEELMALTHAERLSIALEELKAVQPTRGTLRLCASENTRINCNTTLALTYFTILSFKDMLKMIRTISLLEVIVKC